MPCKFPCSEMLSAGSLADETNRTLRNTQIDRDTYRAAVLAIHNEVHNDRRRPFERLAAIARITDQLAEGSNGRDEKTG